MKEEEDTCVSPNKLAACCKSSVVFIILSKSTPSFIALTLTLHQSKLSTALAAPRNL